MFGKNVVSPHPQLVRVIESDAGRGFYAGGKFYEVQ